MKARWFLQGRFTCWTALVLVQWHFFRIGTAELVNVACVVENTLCKGSGSDDEKHFLDCLPLQSWQFNRNLKWRVAQCLYVRCFYTICACQFSVLQPSQGYFLPWKLEALTLVSLSCAVKIAVVYVVVVTVSIMGSYANNGFKWFFILHVNTQLLFTPKAFLKQETCGIL